MVLMAMEVGIPTREDLSAAGKNCVLAAIQELYQGKPDEHFGEIHHSIQGAPEWISSTTGVPTYISISHTSQVAVGVASKRPIGIDLERSGRNVSRLLQSLKPEERDLMPRWRAIEILCAKEAAGKAQQVGLAGSLERWLVSEDRGALTVTDTGSFACDASSTWGIQILERAFLEHTYTCAIATPHYSAAMNQ
jgi:phosphopantetheinyl transferase